VGGSTLLAAAVVSIVMVRNGEPGVRATPPAGGVALATADSARRSAVSTVVPVDSPFRDGAVGAPVQVASTAADPEAAVPVQFVLDATAAASVAVVGDFNDWNASASPMQRLPGSGVWTTTLLMSPGRHVYAFVVDDRTWTPDPRAPRAADSDFGKPGSVLLVTPR
jgi:hypothetical protein